MSFLETKKKLLLSQGSNSTEASVNFSKYSYNKNFKDTGVTNSYK